MSLRSNLGLLVTLASVLSSGCGKSALPPASARAAESTDDGSIRWIGGPTALLEHAGLRVLTDPMLGPRGPNAFSLPKHPSTGEVNAPVTRYLQPGAASLDGLDAVLISHTHHDHVDETAKQRLPKTIPLVVPPAGAAMLQAAGFTNIRSLDWGESTSFQHGDERLVVHAVPAHHSHDPAIEQTLGKGNGYVLEWISPGRMYRMYWTGDAVLSDDMSEATRYGSLDLLVPHLGGVGGDAATGLRTMDAAETVQLVAKLDPRFVLPIHHTTFGHYREPIDALVERMAEAHYAARLRLLRTGERAGFPQ